MQPLVKEEQMHMVAEGIVTCKTQITRNQFNKKGIKALNLSLMTNNVCIIPK